MRDVRMITPKVKLVRIVEGVPDHQSVQSAAKIVAVSGTVPKTAIRPAPQIVRYSALPHDQRARDSIGDLGDFDGRTIQQDPVASRRRRAHYAQIVRAAVMARLI